MRSFIRFLHCILLLTAAAVGAVDRISLDSKQDVNYLPYKTEIVHQMDALAGRITLPVPAQAAVYSHHDTNQAIVLVESNPQFRDNTPARIIGYTLADWESFQNTTIDLLLSDFTCLTDLQTKRLMIVSSGYRNDSAFVARLYVGDAQPEYCFVLAGCSQTQATWKGLREFVYAGDIDGDGHLEAIFHLGSAKKLAGRELCCVDLTTLAVKWRIPFPMFVTEALPVVCPGTTETALLLTSYGARPGVDAPSYADMICHVLRISTAGEIRSDHIIGKTGETVALTVDASTGTAYCGHNVAFAQSSDIADTMKAGAFLSIIDCRDSVEKSVDVGAVPFDIWIGVSPATKEQCIFTLSGPGIIRAWDKHLHLIAESDSLATFNSFCGYMQIEPGEDSAMAFISGASIELYSRTFDKLAIFPTNRRHLARLSNAGEAAYFVASGPEGFAIARMQRRPLLDYLSVIFFDFRYYILGFLSCIVAGLILATHYNRRLRVQTAELQCAHNELAATHRALQQAQEQIVSQEKYRLAQNIAGSFAHEIRNALFPANVSLVKMNEVIDGALPDRSRLDKLMNMATRAITRAISLTNLITQYTKLESQYLPQPTRFAAVIADMLASNTNRVEQQKAIVSTSGPDDAIVTVQAQHLYMILNNLFLNSLDATFETASPRISVTWEVREGCLQIEFSDNGCGIPETDRQRIFEAFYSTKPDHGTGLGLATVKRLIDMYQGQISLVDKAGYNTTFMLVLTLWPPATDGERDETV